MFAQNLPVPDSGDVNYRQQLEYLYARRTMIDELIESLQEYDRIRAQRSLDRNRLPS